MVQHVEVEASVSSRRPAAVTTNAKAREAMGETGGVAWRVVVAAHHIAAAAESSHVVAVVVSHPTSTVLLLEGVVVRPEVAAVVSVVWRGVVVVWIEAEAGEG